MAIRFVDQDSRLARVQVTLQNATALLQGTSAAVQPRTGVIGSQLQPATALIQGVFTTAPNRTGTIAATLSGAASVFTGTFNAGGLESFFSVTPPSLTEGNVGNKNFPFIVQSSQTFGFNVLFDYTTRDATTGTFAVGGSDYQITSGTWTLIAGQTQVTINVPVIGDTVIEPNEMFFFDVFNVRSA